ncbi:MAG: hypothetical protein R3F18_11845 [Lysobacterales bacterium]
MTENASEVAEWLSWQAASSRPEEGLVTGALTDRMLAALGNGVRGKWFSLIDKVHRPSTLRVPGHRCCVTVARRG